MPIAKPQPRQPKPQITKLEYASAEREAKRQIDARDRWQRIATERNTIAAKIRAIREAHGNVEQMIHDGVRDPVIVARFREVAALVRAMKPLDRELAELAKMPRAFAKETIERATWRVLLQRGSKPTHIGRYYYPERTSDQIAATSETVLSHGDRKKFHAWYVQLAKTIADELADMRALRYPTETNDLYAAQLEADLVRLREIVAALTPRAKRSPGGKSAARRRKAEM